MTENTETTEVVTATRTIPASAAQIFAVLADPGAHASIDGTGWVREPLDTAPLTEVGQLFRMAMYHNARAIGDYRVVNQVHTFDRPRTIAWLTGTERPDGTLELGGWLWRYDLTPLGPAETAVTLTYDWSAVPAHIRARGITFPPFGPEHLDNSLHHLTALAVSSRSFAHRN
ncbi:SRPBCC family protein [Amycolatopsis rhabdoformis]|uniref:SRPBCC family protein n=1 Tax=Amycolatopsis rhabdoformis TaxID=1448059 RepID=A0ABZ1HXV2_9PSEU|nr:SRPBCC family protein [Amycolatopsis rhabdoformis]WSE26198.1 SRPBCC family protein [Amycolatopsis rhabdoformis]